MYYLFFKYIYNTLNGNAVIYQVIYKDLPDAFTYINFSINHMISLLRENPFFHLKIHRPHKIHRLLTGNELH